MALSDYDRLQASEFGTYGALRQRPDGTSSMLRRQTEAYSRAQRLLDREARRGNVDSALAAIKLRNESIGAGINTSSLRSYNENRADVAARKGALAERASDNKLQRDVFRKRGMEALNDRYDRKNAEGSLMTDEGQVGAFAQPQRPTLAEVDSKMVVDEERPATPPSQRPQPTTAPNTVGTMDVNKATDVNAPELTTGGVPNDTFGPTPADTMNYFNRGIDADTQRMNQQNEESKKRLDAMKRRFGNGSISQ